MTPRLQFYSVLLRSIASFHPCQVAENGVNKPFSPIKIEDS
nr:MAG TPA: hypothetical protein [Caudoviricetes sp.]